MFCRIFRSSEIYPSELVLMHTFAKNVVVTKYQHSLYQHAAMLHYLLEVATKDMEILCVGSYMDVPAEVLKNMEYHITCIDPVVNMDLHTFYENNLGKKFDLIFSTSVIEHVPDDKLFIREIGSLLKPGALCFVTCDFKADWKLGDHKFSDQRRLYTKDQLLELSGQLSSVGCELTEQPAWDITPEEMDFELSGLHYSAVGMSFRKIL